METLIIAVLAAATVAELIALLIAYGKIRKLEEGGTFTPGKDCLRITYYYLEPERKTGDSAIDLQNAETVTMTLPIEDKDTIISAEGSYRKIKPMPPPPLGKVLISIDITIVPDCNSGGK